MVEHLFPRFLHDDGEYAGARQYWQMLIERSIRRKKQAGLWQMPWLREPFRDGNPIFSALNQRTRKGIVIIQHASKKRDIAMTAYVDFFGGDRTDSDSIADLVVACELSKEAGKLAVALIDAWLTAAFPGDEFDGQIRQILRGIDPP